MPAIYKLVTRKCEIGDPEGATKVYAQQKMIDTATFNNVCDYISRRSGRTSGQVKTIVRDVCREIGTVLSEGQTVRLSDLGSFRVTYHSEGAESADAFTKSNLKSVSVLLRPSVRLKKSADEGIKLINANIFKKKK